MQNAPASGYYADLAHCACGNGQSYNSGNNRGRCGIMMRKPHFARHGIVLIALLGPIVIAGALLPNFRQSKALAGANPNLKPPLVITASPTRAQAVENPLVIPPVPPGTHA